MDHASAFSFDGRIFEFDAPISRVLPLGSFVEVDAPGGQRHLGQILSEHASRRDAGFPRVVGSGMLVATIDGDQRAVQLSASSFGDATIEPAEDAVVASYFASSQGDRTGLDLGAIRPAVGAPARLNASGFSRHTFMCGQSGSGKTYTMGVVLEQLLARTRLPLVILDPNSDYVHLGTVKEQEDSPDCDEIRHAIVEQGRRVSVFGGADSPLSVRLGRLTIPQQLMVFGLDRLADAEEVDVARRIVNEIGTQEYGPEEVRDRVAALDEPAARKLRLRIDNSGMIGTDIWTRGDELPITDRVPDDWRALVFDLGKVARPRDRSIIAAAVVTKIWEERRQRRPVLLVIDEAHNVCPQTPADDSQALVTDHLIAIAGEGRKFGIHLLLATQRPQKVHENVLSQCDNLLLMKMNGAADIRQLATLFSFVPPSLIEMSAGFDQGEGLAAGRIAPGPMLFKTGVRHTPEGGADIPTDWASPLDS